MSVEPTLALDTQAVHVALNSLIDAIDKSTVGFQKIALVGIRRGGAPLAERIQKALLKKRSTPIALGSIDIGLYRDDASTAIANANMGPADIAFSVEGTDVILVDDVLHTGRTIRAAMDCILDYGRPRRIWLAVLCDRGERELPIAPDFCGTYVKVPEGFRLCTHLEDANTDRVVLEAARSKRAGVSA